MLQGADDAEAAEAWGSSVRERIWGPVCGEHTHAIGAPAPVASVLLRPSSAAANLVKQMEALVPVELLPRSEDTQASLVARLAKSEYLHPKLVLSKGNGTGRHKYVDLNSTQYAQPRRVRWGAPMRDPWKKHSEDDNGEVSVHLPCYRHSYSRSPLESTCEVVPEAVNLRTQLLWKEARPFLAPNSMSTPPNYWEQCIYYTAFKGAMGRHRDNFKSHDLVSYLATKDASILTSAKYAQVPNSTVMIFTTGNAPMNFKLSYPVSCENAERIQTYVTHPMLNVKLSHGTLLMFAPTDDLFFCHEVAFDPSTLGECGASGYRIALVMRWIREEYFECFHCKGPSSKHLLVTPSMADAEDERKRQIEKRSRRKRAKSFGGY